MHVVILVRLTGRLNFKRRRTRATQEREGLGLTDSTQLAVCRMHGVTDRTSFIWLFKVAGMAIYSVILCINRL